MAFHRVATLIMVIFLAACSSAITATTSPTATTVVRIESTQTIEQTTPTATFTLYPTKQVIRTKLLDYKTVYEEGDFKIREAFLGSTKGWKWEDFLMPQARIQNTAQDLGTDGRCELAELRTSGGCTNTAKIKNEDGQEHIFAFACDRIGGGYCLLKRDDELIWQGNLVVPVGGAIASSRRIGDEIALGYVTIDPNAPGRTISSILLTKGNTVIDIVKTTNYDAAFTPNEVQGKLIYFALKNKLEFLVFDGKEVGAKYDNIFNQCYCWDGPPVQVACNGEIVDFFATRESGWYHVQAGNLANLR